MGREYIIGGLYPYGHLRDIGTERFKPGAASIVDIAQVQPYGHRHTGQIVPDHRIETEPVALHVVFKTALWETAIQAQAEIDALGVRILNKQYTGK